MHSISVQIFIKTVGKEGKLSSQSSSCTDDLRSSVQSLQEIIPMSFQPTYQTNIGLYYDGLDKITQ